MPTGERIPLFEIFGFYDKTASEILREPYEGYVEPSADDPCPICNGDIRVCDCGKVKR